MSDIDAQLLTTDRPPRGAVERAVREAKAGLKPGESSVNKVIYLDEKGESVGEWATQQAPEDPFAGSAGYDQLQEPPFPLEQLVYLAETHPVHGSALDQKTADVVGKGWSWEANDEQASPTADRDILNEWFESLAPDDSDMQEVLNQMWADYETTGWGLLEIARDPTGRARRVYHVPGHTVRASKNGFALCQIRGQKRVWFRRWGAADIAGEKVNVDAATGALGDTDNPANDLFVLRKSSRRSSYYGIPTYITCIGWITLALAARDDNLMFFANRREPRWAVVISGLSEGDNLVDDIRRAMVVDMRQAYRNMLIPVTGATKVDFQKLSDTAKDGSFGNLSDRADRAIMVAHRVPAERLANSIVGPLGGNNVAQNNRIYKDAVVIPAQTWCNTRIGKLVAVEYEIASGKKPTWKFKLDDLDISDEQQDLDMATQGFKSDLFTLREARARVGLGPLMKPLEVDAETGEVPVDDEGIPLVEPEESELNDMLYTQLPGVSSFDDPAAAEEKPQGPGNERDREDALRVMEVAVENAMGDTRDLLARLDTVEERMQSEYPR